MGGPKFFFSLSPNVGSSSNIVTFFIKSSCCVTFTWLKPRIHLHINIHVFWMWQEIIIIYLFGLLVELKGKDKVAKKGESKRGQGWKKGSLVEERKAP